MKYAWDPRKNRKNLLVHGISLDVAIRIFEGPTLERLDDRFEYGEVRIYPIGVVNGIEITAIYTEVSGTERRIISAWRAERHEREAYWQNIGEAECHGLESPSFTKQRGDQDWY